MSKASTKKNKSIYHLAREKLHLTRADATTYIPDNADFLGINGVNAYYSFQFGVGNQGCVYHKATVIKLSVLREQEV